MSRLQRRVPPFLVILFGSTACTIPEINERAPLYTTPTTAPTTVAVAPASTTPPPVSTTAGIDAASTIDEPSVKLGFHYRPLEDGTTVKEHARQTAFMILTKTDEAYRDKMHAAGYQGLVLQYIRGSEAQGTKTKNASSSCKPENDTWPNQVADQPDDFCTILHPHEDWFLHNTKGQRLYNGDQHFYHMNPANKEWRAFFVERLKRSIFGDSTHAPLGYDGIFLDNVELNLYKKREQLSNSDGGVQEFATNDEYRAAWIDLLKDIKKELGPSIPVWANLISASNTQNDWQVYLPYLDGVMEEAFATGYFDGLRPEEYDLDLKQAELTIAQGKGFYGISQGQKKDKRRQTFALASYLLVTQPGAQAFFRYTDEDTAYDEWWFYDNYNVHLGAPLGGRYKIENGWRRDFTNGYVTVDVNKHTGKMVEGTSPKNAAPTPKTGK